ncbi:MAG: transglutaminase domain-containing protein [Archangium sp.]|nr:transglutaminase domain-containing protein [Archangium sp.]
MRSLSLALAALLVSGCATLAPTLTRVTPKDDAKLAASAEAFYRAQTPDQLRAAVADAKAAGPGTALHHELAARLAQLEARDADVISNLVAVLADTAGDAALFHLHLLASLELTWSERAIVRELYRALMEGHPSPEVRALAASHLAIMLNAEGDFTGRDAAVASIPGQLDLAFVGTWDNDQGKGFDLEFAPELRPGLTETYEGRTGKLEWRRDVPKDPRGRYDLLMLMTPTRWAAAFAQGTFTAGADGPHALRLTTSDPLKVWVDGRLVFAAAQLDRSVPDHLVVPLELTKGSHTVLIKSAHREGLWHLTARVTPYDGAMFKRELDPMLASRVALLSSTPARQLAQLVGWAHLSAGGATTVRLADAAVAKLPRSLVLRSWVVDALWYNQERGRTADLLAALDAEVGEQLPFIRLRQARFHQQQGLKQKARERLLQLQKDAPQLREVWDLLADVWRGEGWTEDELRVLKARAERFGTSPEEDLERSRALSRAGKRDEAIAVVDDVLAELPYHPEALRREADLAFDAADFSEAKRHQEARLESWPVDYSAWLAVAETHRRLGDFKASEAALLKAEALSPEASVPKSKRGELAYERGDTATAVTLWKRSVELNPENEALANRVEFLSPETRGEWMADMPDEARLEALVKERARLKQLSGADVAYLLDHEVTLLNTDGSTSNVVTVVIHAWNSQGRDRIIRQSVGAGRLRVLHAYAVDEKGQRSEASSERNRQIFFRGMQPGSTLVLQYRLDSAPRGYLSRYYNETWSFQGVGDQREESTLVLWAPLTAKLHEYKVGEAKHTQEKRGELLRFTWTTRNTPPLISEPGMPTVGELAINIHLSTVPDWKTWLSWEQALLEGVFRDSPELEVIARGLGRGNPEPTERLERIHTFVMEEIRYQQDYESFIAGVKPHPASMTLERRYGDCKDKAVLFIELARKLGVEAHFALVRTRDVGPVRQDVPMQQFNHAIVYVPEQPGVTARFFDPTAELLDVASVRSDDVGTQSLVFDPKTNLHTWREIAFQPPEANRETTTVALDLDPKGGAKGTLTLEAVGRSGSLIRRTSKNQAVFTQVAQRIASAYLPNATTSDVRALEVESLRVPAAIRMEVAAGTFARTEGDTLRLKLPSDANPRGTFALATRNHPLLLGTPTQQQMQLELTLPEGFETKKLPSGGTVSLPCLSLTREVSQVGRVVKSKQTWRTTCERLSAQEYPAYRAKLDDMVRLLDDELVLGPAKGVTAVKKAK